MVSPFAKTPTILTKAILYFCFFIQLGDPDNKAASNADYHLSNLLADHPNMKVCILINLYCFNVVNSGLGVPKFMFLGNFWSLSMLLENICILTKHY